MTAIDPPPCHCGHPITDHEENVDYCAMTWPCWLCACSEYRPDTSQVPR